MFELPAPLTERTLADAVRRWIEEHLPAGWSDAAADDVATAWFDSLGEAGLATPTWPREHGGLGLDARLAAVVVDELAVRDAGVREPTFIGIGLAGPTILKWGDEAQKSRHLGPIARSRTQWCQLFSEPGSGSDLASLATRAVQQPDGDWIVNGQKVWSSYAHLAQFGLLMTRTNPEAPKHKGITYFLLDMSTPGVEARPLKQMNGEAEFNEVFLNDVRVPDSARLGRVDQGWSVAITTLMNERSGLSGRPAVGEGEVETLVRRAVASGTWQDDPVLRDRLMEALVAEKTLQMLTVRAFVQSGSADASAEGSIRKLAHATLLERLGLLATEVTPGGGLGGIDAADVVAAHEFLSSKKLSIAGGTSEIQRNIIGERLLGLPRDRDPYVDVPFNERPRS